MKHQKKKMKVMIIQKLYRSHYLKNDYNQLCSDHQRLSKRRDRINFETYNMFQNLYRPFVMNYIMRYSRKMNLIIIF